MIFNGRDLPCRRSFATDCGRDHWAVWRKLLLRCNPKVSPCDLNVSPCNPKVSICNPRSKHLSFPVNLGLCPDGEPVGASLGLGRASERSLAWESCVLLGNPVLYAKNSSVPAHHSLSVGAALHPAGTASGGVAGHSTGGRSNSMRGRQKRTFGTPRSRMPTCCCYNSFTSGLRFSA